MSDDIHALQDALWEPAWEEFETTFSTNVTGVYFTCVAFLPLLHQGNKRFLQKWGYSSQIVVTSSISGYSKQIQSSIAYSCSKAAATHLARNLSTYFVHLEIRVNVIVPGAFPSEMTGGPDGSDERGHVSMEGREALWDDVPAKRPGMEREMAGLGTFLARCQTPLSVFVDTYVQSCWWLFEWCCYCCRRWTSPSETECFLISLAQDFHSLRSLWCVSVLVFFLFTSEIAGRLLFIYILL